MSLHCTGIALNSKHRLNKAIFLYRSLYNALGRPLDGIPAIHVGGTNGKGSVCHKVAQCLINSNIKTGLFVSPHISSFRERVQVNGRGLNEEDIFVRIV